MTTVKPGAAVTGAGYQFADGQKIIPERQEPYTTKTVTAADVYADPSALLTLYVHQTESRRMSSWRARTKGAYLTHHGRLEIVNGICLAAFRNHITTRRV
jgi:hypothetical protein